MEPTSQEKLVTRIYDVDDPLTAAGLLVLAHRISEYAFGITLDQAATLAAHAIHGWFPFTSWAARRGISTERMPTHILLPSVYSWLVDGCKEKKDLDRLNRRIFGRVSPW